MSIGVCLPKLLRKIKIKENSYHVLCLRMVMKLKKGIFRDPQSGVHFSSQQAYILKELSYTNLTSIGLLQKQNGFDKRGRSVHFFEILCPDIEITVQCSMEKHNSCYSAYLAMQRKIIANKNFEHNLSN